MDIVASDMSYLINLDHLDLNYISNYDFQNGSSPFPLWDVNSSKGFGNEKEYFEFKVMAKKVADDGADDSSSEPGDTEDETIGYPLYKCAICDRDVPLTYKKQHIESVKHQTCIQIAKAVLQRIQNNLKLEDEYEIVKDSTLTYFCEPCTVIVRNTDKQQHEGSEAHQKSVLRDLYLSDLLNIYNDENYLDTADMQYMKQKPNEKPKNFGNKSSQTENSKLSKTVKCNETVTQDKGIQKVKTTLFSDNKQIKKNNNPVHEQNGTFNDASCDIPKDSNKQQSKLETVKHDVTAGSLDQNNTTKLKDLFTKNKISIDKPSKSKQNGTNDDQMINRTESIEECDLNDNKIDMQKQKTPINAQSNVTNENNCSEKTANVQSQATRLAKKQGEAKSQKNVINKRNDSEVDYIMLVDTNEFNVDTESDTVLEEVKLRSYIDFLARKNIASETPNHKVTVISRNYVQITTLDNNVVTVPADNFNGFQKPSELLLCNVCMVKVDDPGMHILEKMHLEMIRLPLKDIHCFRELNAMCRHCVHCNAVFVSTDAHDETSEHKAALQKALEGIIPTERAQTKKMGRTYCEPCKIYIDSHNFNSHTKGKPHKNNLSLFFTRENKESSTSTSNNSQGKIHCEPCGMLIHKEVFSGHIYGKSHRAAVKLTNESKDLENCCSICNILTADLSVHLTSDYHEFHVNKKSCKKVDEPNPSIPPPQVINKYQIAYHSETQAVCRVCDVKIPNKVENVNEHTNGRSHKRNYSTILQVNSMKKIGEDFFCELCKVTVKTSDELEHMISATHSAYKLKSETQVKSHISTEDTPICTQSTSSSIPTQDASSLTPQPSTTNTSVYWCESCEENVVNTPTAIKEHVDGLSHKITKIFWKLTNGSLEDNLHYHYEKVTSNTVYCRICKIDVLSSNADKHLESVAHDLKYLSHLAENDVRKLSESKFYCNVCSIDVKVEEELQHIRLPSHFMKKNKTRSVENKTETDSAQETASSSKGTGYRCAVCNVDVPNNLKNIKMHDQGISHKTKLKNLTLVDEEKVLFAQTPNGKEMKCTLCNVTVALTGLTQHVRGAKHKANKNAAIGGK